MKEALTIIATLIFVPILAIGINNWLKPKLPKPPKFISNDENQRTDVLTEIQFDCFTIEESKRFYKNGYTSTHGYKGKKNR